MLLCSIEPVAIIPNCLGLLQPLVRWSSLQRTFVSATHALGQTGVPLPRIRQCKRNIGYQYRLYAAAARYSSPPTRRLGIGRARRSLPSKVAQTDEQSYENPSRSVLALETGNQRLAHGIHIAESPDRPRQPHATWGTTRTFRATPSQTIIAALKEVGCLHAIPPEVSNKADLSHVSVYASRRARALARREAQVKKEDVQLEYRMDLKPRLQSLLGAFIRKVYPLMMESNTGVGAEESLCRIEDILDQRSLQVLEDKGYTLSDLYKWTKIITATSTEEAVSRLNAYGTGHGIHLPAPIPFFVFMFILRRKDITVYSLRLLIDHAWALINQSYVPGRLPFLSPDAGETALLPMPPLQKKKPAVNQISFPGLSRSSVNIILVRLLRHARRLWPAAFVNIVEMISGNTVIPSTSVLNARQSADLSFLYNRTLTLLALPSRQNPMLSVPHHQEAQFNILRKMNSFNPPIVISREGYRAITAIQLAHRKTSREREWGKMKAKSWPPWKEERIGIDADKGTDLGVSRAKESLRQAKKAGYGPRSWEEVASVLAGWDTDGSPTIQTRTVLRGSQLRKSISRMAKTTETTRSGGADSEAVWAVRVRATRTVNEAWACFLAYKDHMHPKTSDVYYNMFEKLVSEDKSRGNDHKKMAATPTLPAEMSQAILPGDGREVTAAPTNPQQSIYVRTPAPGVNALFNMMIVDGQRPTRRCLELLLSYARYPTLGLKYLSSSKLPQNVILALLGLYNPKEETGHVLQKLHVRTFAAFIDLLCRFPLEKAPPIIKLEIRDQVERLSLKPFVHAKQLVTAVKPHYRPPWYSLLRMLARLSSDRLSLATEKNINGVAMSQWTATIGILDEMDKIRLDLDFAGLQIVCITLEMAIFDNLRAPVAKRPLRTSNPASARELRFLRDHAAAMMTESGPEKVKQLFRNIISANFPSESLREDGVNQFGPPPSDGHGPATHLPQLTAIPAPAHLHQLIRALGLGQDYEGLKHLVQWMAAWETELRSVAEEMANGSTMMRRSLAAVRVFLERAWIVTEESFDKDEDANDKLGAPFEMVAEVRDIIEGVETWGGWATDLEVDSYCRSGRFP